jgi:putative transposase
VSTLIARLCHVRFTLRGTSYLLHRLGYTPYLLHRLGYTPQVPIHRAAERDEQAIAGWKTTTWAKLRG